MKIQLPMIKNIYAPLIFLILLPFITTVSAAGLTVLAFGDPGTGGIDQYEVAETMGARCNQVSCDMAIMLGDNIYENGVSNVNDGQFIDKFETPYSPLGLKIFPTLGNHDARGNTNAQVKYTELSNSWVFPAKFHDFVKGPVHFFVINSNNFNAVQRTWLEDALKNSTSRWKVVYGHHPIRSYGQHGHTGQLVRNLEPLLCQHADMYVSGHDHDMQYLRSDCGLELVVSGAAGKIRSSSTGRHSLFGVGRTFGFSILEFDQKNIVTTFYNKANEKLYSRTFDGTKIVRGNNQTNPTKLSFSKSIYAVNESIVVNYENMQGNETDWVGLAKVDTADSAYLDFKFTQGKKSGVFTFDGLEAGEYEVRAYFNDSYALEALIAFTVK